MRILSNLATLAALVCIGQAAHAEVTPEGETAVAFRQTPGKIMIRIGDTPVATYVYEDDNISRPYFAHVKTLGGVQVTRNHPPIEGQDRTDHNTMHPGIWMAFGDLDGSDFWRNKGRVVQERLIGKPTGGIGEGTFTVRKRYERPDGATVCREDCRYTFRVRKDAYLILWDATFSADREFYFGDQEEMGLGLRVATPISVQQGGRMFDTAGRRNEREIWGNTAAWVDYGGTVGDQHLGMTLMCHPENFRPCWMHARDYGFVTANPFGRAAFQKGPPSKVVVKLGTSLRLRYGILVHAGPKDSRPDLKAAYADYVRLAEE